MLGKQQQVDWAVEALRATNDPATCLEGDLPIRKSNDWQKDLLRPDLAVWLDNKICNAQAGLKQLRVLLASNQDSKEAAKLLVAKSPALVELHAIWDAQQLVSPSGKTTAKLLNLTPVCCRPYSASSYAALVGVLAFLKLCIPTSTTCR